MSTRTTTPPEYPANIKKLIADISGIQTSLADAKALSRSWSDIVFCGDGGPMKANRWSQLKNGVYPFPSTISAQMRLHDELKALLLHGQRHEMAVRKAALDAAARETQRPYIEFAEHRVVVKGLESCEKKAATLSQVRAVVFVGNSGAGKTEMLHELERSGKVQWSVSGKPGWRNAYAAFLASLGVSLGLSLPRGNWRAEALILQHMGTLTGVLAIEEIEDLSKEALEFLKTLLNNTRITLLLLLTPDSYRRICSASGLSEQLNRRTHVTVESGLVTPAKIRAFAPDLWTDIDDDDQRFTMITRQANALGALCCVQTITDELMKLHKKDSLPPSLTEVEKAVAFYSGCKRKQSILTKGHKIKIAA